MINQNLENITQSGTSQVIDVQAGGLSFSPAQGYCIIFCVTIVLITLIFSITRLIQTAMLRMNFITPKLIKDIKKQIVAELK